MIANTGLDAPKQVGAGIRGMTLFIAGLAVVVGPLLVLLPDRTDRLFAWTIQPPVTAAFLGGGYCTALVIEIMAARQRVWRRARVVYPAVLLFTSLTLIATLLHLDRFHFGSAILAARATAWAWFVIYLVAPPAMLALLVYQIRRTGSTARPGPPLGPIFRSVLGLEGGVMATIGVGLFIAAPAIRALWPWALTPLTSRAVGAWLVGLGTAALQASWENDWDLAIPALVGNIVFAVVELLGVARFSTALSWRGTAPAYLVMLLAVLSVGVYGWTAARRLGRTWLS